MGCNSLGRLNLYLLTLGTEIGNYHRVNDDGIYFMAFVSLTAKWERVLELLLLPLGCLI